MKVCKSCNELKPLNEYHKHTTSKDGIRTRCKVCTRKENMDSYNNNDKRKEQHRAAARRYQVKQYGITYEEYLQMLKDQKHSCKICEAPILEMGNERHKVATIDHCHTTDKVRGLLCFHCNIGLGKFFDKPNLLIKAAEYLQCAY